jgi:acyl carrier protein
MIPAFWVEMESFPLTANGKIDKKALPEPDDENVVHRDYVPPQTEMEEKLANIWKELLQLAQVGIHDNFFELGGHSLLAKRASSYIERTLFLSVPIHALFQFTTINELGKYLEIQLDRNQQVKETEGFKFVSI